MAQFNILYLSSEVFPFAKVGGLADVAGALPKALKDREHDVRVLMPKYKKIRDRKYNLREVIRLREIHVPLGDQTITVSVKSGFLPDSKVQAYFLEYKPLFDRADVYVDPKTKEGWEDNHLRFALFARTAFEMLKVLFWQPDLIHVNDWTSSLVPFYLKTVYKDDEFFQNTRTLLTIHNLAYQGVFSAETAQQIGADIIPFDETHPAWDNGNFNYLKAGLATADLISTVSPTYAREILTPEFGSGLDGLLQTRKDVLHGVLNGIDVDEWNPEVDKHIAKNYTIEELDNKAANRAALLEEMDIEADDDTMVIGLISRLATQKGFDLLEEAAEKLMEMPIVLVILGTGQSDVEEMVKGLVEKYPGRVVAKIDFSDELAHKIEAGADAFLMPSHYEPCGLNQMYSMAYGTPPIVHAVGGLVDTVENARPKKKTGTGFVFDSYSADKLVDAVKRAVEAFKDKEAWTAIMRNGMQRDFSWNASAEALEDVYKLSMGEAVTG
ncbi:glycogen synthase GlgA [bacterium]|nr:glycogen synthase GlgA [bacterium]